MTSNTNDVYDQFDKAFRNVSAYCVIWQGQPVAQVCFRHPDDGAGRLWAYVHWYGVPMVRGYAGGFGYDKRSAAVSVAVRKMGVSAGGHVSPDIQAAYEAFISATREDAGHYWNNRLEHAGFTVRQVI